MDDLRKQISDKPAVCNGGRWATSDAFISDGFFQGISLTQMKAKEFYLLLVREDI